MVKTYEDQAGGASVVVGFAGEGPHVEAATHVALNDEEALTGVWRRCTKRSALPDSGSPPQVDPK